MITGKASSSRHNHWAGVRFLDGVTCSLLEHLDFDFILMYGEKRIKIFLIYILLFKLTFLTF